MKFPQIWVREIELGKVRVIVIDKNLNEYQATFLTNNEIKMTKSEKSLPEKILQIMQEGVRLLLRKKQRKTLEEMCKKSIVTTVGVQINLSLNQDTQ